jgi:hypothetical protein
LYSHNTTRSDDSVIINSVTNHGASKNVLRINLNENGDPYIVDEQLRK